MTNDDAPKRRAHLNTELVFVVEDDPQVLRIFERSLTKFGYRVQAFGSPSVALAEIPSAEPGVIVTDMDMPGMSGLDLAECVKEIRPDVRFVMVTGAGSEATAQRALRLGIIDYLKKPVDLTELARSVQRAFTQRELDEFERAANLRLRNEVEEKTQQIHDVTLGALAALLNALEARNPHFKGHSQAVSLCAAGIARAIDMNSAQVDAVRTAGLLHDIGMIGVPDSIVAKPDSLVYEERQLIEEHCRKGVEILEPLSHLGSSITYVLEHHERLDGTGYPDRKRGDEITLGGQIVGLAEAWTALTEVRPFRDRLSKGDAMAMLAGASGKWFAPELLQGLRDSLASS